MYRHIVKYYHKFTDFLHNHPVLTGLFFAPTGALLFALAASWLFHLDKTQTFALITPSLVFFGGLFAALVAVRNTKESAIIMRDKATIDLIIREETDSYILKKRCEFLKLRNKGDLVQWSLGYGEGKFKPNQKKEGNDSNVQEAKKQEEEAKREIQAAQEAIGFVLNKYEMIAIGIANNVLSEKVYREWIGSTIIQDYKELSPCIAQIRKDYNKPKLFYAFEQLAFKIENQPS